MVGDFSAPAVERSNCTCPKSDGIDKNLLTTAEEESHYQSITKPTRFRLGNRPSVLDIVFTKFPDTVSAIKLLAPLGNGDHELLFFTFGLHDSHEPPRPRAKWCYNERMKDAVVEAAALFDWNDASLARNVEDQLNLIKERILCLVISLQPFAHVRAQIEAQTSPANEAPRLSTILAESSSVCPHFVPGRG